MLCIGYIKRTRSLDQRKIGGFRFIERKTKNQNGDRNMDKLVLISVEFVQPKKSGFAECKFVAAV